MKRQKRRQATPDGSPDRLQQLRRAKGLSRRQLAAASGLRRRKIASFERGSATIPEGDLSVLAGALGVEVGVLGPSGSSLALAAGASSNGAVLELRGEAAFEALLREYLSMVVELRGSRQPAPGSLREDDLRELSRALGDTPEAIEARLMELLGSDQHEAWELRTTLLSSPSASAFATSPGTDLP